MRGEATLKLTHADYLLFPEDGKRHELLNGEHYVTAAPRLRHQEVSQNLNLLLAVFVRKHSLGKVYAAPCDVILSDHDVVQPDLLFVSNERSAVLQDWVRGAPDLVVEILSPSTRSRDESLKRNIYERRGVREYWIVDPEAETVTTCRFGEAGSSERFDRERTLRTPLLPGLAIPVVAIFE